MTGFEPRTSGIGSDRSTNWATTTAHIFPIIVLHVKHPNYQQHICHSLALFMYLLGMLTMSFLIFLNGPFPASFLFSSFQTVDSKQIMSDIKVCRWLDSNSGSLVSESTALPTEPQPLPISFLIYALHVYTYHVVAIRCLIPTEVVSVNSIFVKLNPPHLPHHLTDHHHHQQHRAL